MLEMKPPDFHHIFIILVPDIFLQTFFKQIFSQLCLLHLACFQNILRCGLRIWCFSISVVDIRSFCHPLLQEIRGMETVSERWWRLWKMERAWPEPLSTDTYTLPISLSCTPLHTPLLKPHHAHSQHKHPVKNLTMFYTPNPPIP